MKCDPLLLPLSKCWPRSPTLQPYPQRSTNSEKVAIFGLSIIQGADPKFQHFEFCSWILSSWKCWATIWYKVTTMGMLCGHVKILASASKWPRMEAIFEYFFNGSKMAIDLVPLGIFKWFLQWWSSIQRLFKCPHYLSQQCWDCWAAPENPHFSGSIK